MDSEEEVVVVVGAVEAGRTIESALRRSKNTMRGSSDSTMMFWEYPRKKKRNSGQH